jgi:hypothetical protein
MTTIQYYKDMRRSIAEFKKAAKHLEFCTNEVKHIVDFLPEKEELLLQKQLERQQFEHDLYNMKLAELKEAIQKYGYHVLPETQLSNMKDELKDYKQKFIQKVNEEVQLFKSNLETQLTNQLREKQLEHEKEVSILECKLELSKQKLEYFSQVNKLHTLNSNELPSTPLPTPPLTPLSTPTPTPTPTPTQTPTPTSAITMQPLEMIEEEEEEEE